MSRMCMTKYLYAIANDDKTIECSDCNMRTTCKQKSEEKQREELLIQLFRGTTETMRVAIIEILKDTQECNNETK